MRYKMVSAAFHNIFLYRFIYCVVFLSSFVLSIQADKHLNANGPFRKPHTVGYEPNPYACNRGLGLSSSLFPQRTKAIQEIQVSKTFYASNEQIDLTWTPIVASCKDDFIGIFYAEVRPERGKCVVFLGFMGRKSRNLSPS